MKLQRTRLAFASRIGRRSVCFGIGALILFAAASALGDAAAPTEIRVFDVAIDGKPAGEYRLTLRQLSANRLDAELQARVEVRFLLFRYRYSYDGFESWNDGKLESLKARTDDDGTKSSVEAAAAGDELEIRAKQSARKVARNVWPTTYLLLPTKNAGALLTLLDVETGEEESAKFRSVGRESLVVDGQPRLCQRVHVDGKIPAELWYDEQGRLVRQETVEDGHPTVVHLRRINP